MARKKRRNILESVSTLQLLWGLAFLVLFIIILYFLSPSIRIWQARHSPVIFPLGTVRGIDVSHYQGEIDWDEVAQSDLDGDPVAFAFIKATEGKTILDEYFMYNFSEAHKNNIIRGAYHVFSSKSSAQEQADFFCNVVDLKVRDLFPVLDIETLGRYSPKELREGVLDWMNIVERHFGVTPILYTSYSFKKDYLSGPEFDKYPYWIAHYYVSELEYQGKWMFWQHTDNGELNGIKGLVDIDVFNGSFSDLMCLTITKDHIKAKENRKGYKHW
ncbi:MAG: glycoside hydrolase family 25 protein [Bacteroidaceae bacterium]|nr:glycoside hydrolase family 25 protein [Bacteroidaceae bacterium]